MHIVDVNLISADKYLFVKVITDSGLFGIGEVGVWGLLEAAGSAINKYKDYIIGKNPMQIEHLWQYMYRGLYFRGSVVMSAISALDIALWDIKGKALGVPVYELLGGKCRDRIRTYAPVFSYKAEEMAKECVDLKRRGFTAARLIIPDLSYSGQTNKPIIYSNKILEAIEKVRCCRDAVGYDFDLCIEVHRSMTVSEAITFAKGIESLYPYFIEDPIPPDCNEAMVQVSGNTSIPIATGERAINIQEFESLLAKQGARYIRPDLCAVGGITAAKKIAALAEAHYVGVVPHNPLSLISTAACMQINACIPNFAIQELPSFFLDGKEDAMFKEKLDIEDGHILIPDRPGIGFNLADNIAELFPSRPRDLTVGIGYDKSIIDR